MVLMSSGFGFHTRKDHPVTPFLLYFDFRDTEWMAVQGTTKNLGFQ